MRATELKKGLTLPRVRAIEPELKRLAGITDHRGMSTVSAPANHVTARFGTEEWFKRPVNDMQMPVGFRGRKK